MLEKNPTEQKKQIKNEITIRAQYTKSLKIDNLEFLKHLEQKAKPNFKVNISVNSNSLEDDNYEVILTADIEAIQNDKPIVALNLDYAGVFKVSGLEKEKLIPFLFVECPRWLFPFARKIIAEITVDAGFSPLYLSPIDFAASFREKQKEMQSKANKKKSDQAPSLNGSGESSEN